MGRRANGDRAIEESGLSVGSRDGQTETKSGDDRDGHALRHRRARSFRKFTIRPVSSNQRAMGQMTGLIVDERMDPNSVHPCSTAQRSAPAIRAAPTLSAGRQDRFTTLPDTRRDRLSSYRQCCGWIVPQTRSPALFVERKKHLGRFVSVPREERSAAARCSGSSGHNAARMRIHAPMSWGSAARTCVIR